MRTHAHLFSTPICLPAFVLMEDLPAGVDARKDYNDEGRKLIRALGFNSSATTVYNDMDAIFKDPSTGGVVYVGNEVAARGPATKLLSLGITHVVNCTDDMKNFCEVPETYEPHPMANAKRIKYLRFNIAQYRAAGEKLREHPASETEIDQFIRTLFAFVSEALAGGGSVLVHCLAGAHRAGTTGCLLLMWKAGLGALEAVKAAKSLRPVINPIGGLPGLLRLFEHRRDKVLEFETAS